MAKIGGFDASALPDDSASTCYITIVCLRSYRKNACKDVQTLQSSSIPFAPAQSY